MTRRRVSRPPALPANALPNLGLWLDASTLTDADGTALASWPDASGNASHAVQATGANQPLVKTNILNGKRVVRFDGSNDSLVSPYTGNPGTLVVVYYPRDTTSSHGVMGGKGTTSFGGYGVENRLAGGQSEAFMVRTVDSASTPLQAGTLSHGAAWQIVVVTYDPATGTVTYRVNGKTVNDSRALSGALRTNTGTVLGGVWFNGVVDIGNVDIAEAFIYSDVKTDAQIDQLGRMLASKWALTWHSTPRDPSAYTYVASLFSYAAQGPESMFLIGSNDGTTWDLAADRVYSSEVSGSATRDPDIYKHTDGYWYLTHTYLTGFTGHTNKIGLARSADLKTWTVVGAPAIASPFGSGGSTWSPMWFVDAGQVYLLVSYSPTGDAGPFTRYYIPVTDMATGTLGTPTAMTGTSLESSVIDGVPVKIGSTYHWIHKDEAGTKKLNHWTSSSPFSGYTLYAAGISVGQCEGPTLVNMGGSTWRCYFDRFNNAGGNRLAYMVSTDDLATWSGDTAVAYVAEQARFAATPGLQNGKFTVRT